MTPVPARQPYAPCPVCGTYCLGRHDAAPVEAVDYPQIGERVAYTKGDGSGTVLAYVERVAVHDGDADLRFDDGQPGAVDVKPGHGERHTYRRIDVPHSAPSASSNNRRLT